METKGFSQFKIIINVLVSSFWFLCTATPNFSENKIFPVFIHVNATWEVGDGGFEPHYGLQVSKKQKVSSLLTRNDSILSKASVTEK